MYVHRKVFRLLMEHPGSRFLIKTLVFVVNPANSDDLWAGTSSGVENFSNQRFYLYNSNNSIMSNNYIQALVIDGDTKWIGTWGGGVYKFDSIGWAKMNLDITQDVAEIKNYNFSIYPNPTKDIIHIEFKNSRFTNKLIEIYNSNGQVVLSKKPVSSDNNIMINMSELSQGIYILRVQNDEEFSIKQIIKE